MLVLFLQNGKAHWLLHFQSSSSRFGTSSTGPMTSEFHKVMCQASVRAAWVELLRNTCSSNRHPRFSLPLTNHWGLEIRHRPGWVFENKVSRYDRIGENGRRKRRDDRESFWEKLTGWEQRGARPDGGQLSGKWPIITFNELEQGLPGRLFISQSSRRLIYFEGP